MSDDDASGVVGPQPASGPMDKATADWYVEYTGGQFAAFEADDGQWFLYTPVPDPTTPGPTAPADAASGRAIAAEESR